MVAQSAAGAFGRPLGIYRPPYSLSSLNAEDAQTPLATPQPTVRVVIEVCLVFDINDELGVGDLGNCDAS
jgi:hypothetical protein